MRFTFRRRDDQYGVAGLPLVLGLIVLWSGCVPDPQHVAPALAHATPDALDVKDSWDRRTLGWLEVATTQSIECPMSILEAREVREAQRRTRAVDLLVNEIACLCDVRLHAGRVLFPGACTLENNHVRPYRYRRDDGREPAADEQHLVAWQHRLAARISGGAVPANLVRSEPLDGQRAALADAQAAAGARNLRSWRDVERTFERLEKDAGGGFACLLAGDLARLEKDVAHHERVDLQGRPSMPGRELLARGKELVAPQRGKMKTCDALERDPEYQRIDAKLDGALKRQRRERQLAGASRDQADCNADNDRSSLCVASREVQKLERQIDQIARKHGAKK